MAESSIATQSIPAFAALAGVALTVLVGGTQQNRRERQQRRDQLSGELRKAYSTFIAEAARRWRQAASGTPVDVDAAVLMDAAESEIVLLAGGFDETAFHGIYNTGDDAAALATFDERASDSYRRAEQDAIAKWDVARKVFADELRKHL